LCGVVEGDGFGDGPIGVLKLFFNPKKKQNKTKKSIIICCVNGTGFDKKNENNIKQQRRL